MRLAVVFTFVFLLATAFRTGWTTPETDFPNYYTAAKLVREGQPLRPYYDWTWFARQMNYAGNGMQLGAYTPQTPLTMLPIVGLAGLPPQRAKQIWLILNLFFLAATAWLLSRVSRFSFETIWVLAFCGYFSIRTNFLYGQYYIFLLLLLTLTYYFLHRGNLLSSGLLAGIAFGLKLYGGPLLLFFVARRHWRAVLGMILAGLMLLGVAVHLFGWSDIHYYATQILPRSLEGGSIDPYNPGLPTFSTLLRRTFLAEAELNPQPSFPAPWLFFSLRTFLSLSIILLLFLGTNRQQSSERHDFAWFLIAVLLLSTSTASYTFILLLLPLVLLLEESGPRKSRMLVVFYVLMTLPLHPVWLFPKVWLLFGLFFFEGYRNLSLIPRQHALAGFAALALISFLDAKRHMVSYAQEPAQKFEHVTVRPGAIFSSFPVAARAGVFYQSMGKDRYVLRWLHDGQNAELGFSGQALHPRLAADGESIDFELVASGVSTMMRFNPSSLTATSQTIAVPGDSPVPASSPDGRWLAFETERDGFSQISLKDLLYGTQIPLTSGNCNNSAPAWELDSKSILFASDCGRAFGLPALYRAPVPGN